MLNCSKKFFLLFLSLCVLKQTYAMEIKEKQDSKISLFLCLQNNDIEGAKKLLNEKVPLTNLTSDFDDTDSNAYSDTDSENSDSENTGNIFHEMLPPEAIRMIITHARFDAYNEKADKELESTVITACCVFNKIVPNFPKELQFHIFSYLIESDSFDGFTKKFFRQAVKLNFNFPFLNHTNKQICGIKKLLESKSHLKKTPLETLKFTLGNRFTRVTIDKNEDEMKNLLSVENLQNDADEFDKAYKESNLESLSENNLKYQIYLNSKNLLLEQ